MPRIVRLMLITAKMTQTYFHEKLPTAANPADQKENILAEQNGADPEITTTYGLVVKSASVNPSIISRRQKGSTIIVVADFTTSVLYGKKTKGSSIVIGDEIRNTLDSSWTDEHLLTLKHENGGIHVVADKMIDPDDSDSN